MTVRVNEIPVPPERSAVVAIITYNSAAHLAPVVASALRCTSASVRVLVIDNSSSDDTVARARTMPGVTVIETGANLGYSGAINVARRHVRSGEALAVLNPDLVMHPGSLEALLHALDDPAVGIAVPLLREPNGNLFHHLRLEPRLPGALGEALFGAHWAGRPRWASDTLRRTMDYATTQDVEWAGGAALVISPDCNARVGEWSSDTYFLYSEETDYARRVRDAGYRIRFVPEAEATHVGGGSGQSPALLALMAVNRVRYYESRHAPLPSALFRTVVALHHLLRSGDPRHRLAARAVCSRWTWNRLPGARRDGAITGGGPITSLTGPAGEQ